MNGSRSNIPNHDGRSSLDQLNRTIEGLEARIQGLVSERKAQPARAYDPRTNPVDEILERQRMLGGARERVAAAIDRTPQRHEPNAYGRSEWNEPQRAYQPQQSAALGDIAATLSELRAEIRHGFSDSIAPDLEEIRTDMRSLKQATANVSDGAHLLRDDLARLGESIERLGSGNRYGEAQDLRADLDELKALAAGIGREDSVRHLQQRWEQAEMKIDAFNPEALKKEIVQLAWRIDEMKSELGGYSAAPAIRALEDKLIALASSIETLGRHVESRTDMSGQFAGLDHRLDEISRAIAASMRQGASSMDSNSLQRIEDRISGLAAHIDALHDQNHETELAERIDTLTRRIEEIADEDAAHKLEERIAQLSTLIERNFREARQPEMSGHLADISRKIDGLGGGQSDALMNRLEMLSQRLDSFEMPAEPAPLAMADLTAMSRLETRLADIAARLDESAAAPAADLGAMLNLERQIANLSGLLNAPQASFTAPASDEFVGRMAAIEDYMASSDEFIVEAARQAAEAVVEAYSRSGMGANSTNPAEISAIAGLAEDLRALESHTRASEERTADTFTALHQTLIQIAGRLDELGEYSPAPERQQQAMPGRETAHMPKASQPEFEPVASAFEHEPPRAAPKNSKVDILQDVEIPLEAAEADIADDPVTMVAPAPVKEKPVSKSLIAGLAARLRPGRKQEEPSRVSVHPTPALDAADMMVPEEDGILMEPGSGAPDIKKIMEKVRAGQKSAGTNAKPASVGQADVIAAARRAAQAAAREAGNQTFTPPSAKTKAATGAKGSKSLLSGTSEVRRPILLAAAAVLLVVMSYPLVSNLIGGRHANAPAEQPAAIATPTAQENSAVEPQPSATPVDDANVTDGADQTMPAATPVSTQEKSETGSEKLMTPAENASRASVLEKPTASVDAATEQHEASTLSAPEKTATTETIASAPQSEIAIPTGLQPASLVEAVKKADPLAYFEIGSRYTDGRGFKIDLASAAKWYELSAAKGFAPAEYRLASFYEKGTGVTRDLQKAKTLYLSAAEKGNASAMHNLAVIHATGSAGTPDFKEAARWFTQAADFNIRDSQFNLAILYARGNGVAQDLTESYKWFAVAAAQGDQDAAQKRDEVANAMSAEQLKAAKAKFDLWKPKELNDAANTPIVPDEWVAKSNTTASIDMKRAIRNIQAILNNNGFDAGTPDGEMGKKTVNAIKAFQKSIGQEPNGQINDALVKELLKRNRKA